MDKKKRQTLKDLWDHTKKCNIDIIRIPEGEEKKGRVEKVLKEIMTKILPYLGRRMHLQIQEAEHTRNRINPKKYMPRNIIITLLKTKANILKSQ